MNRRQVARIVVSVLVLALLFSVAGQALAVGPGSSDNANAPARKIVVFKDSVTSEGAQEQIVAQAGATKVKHLRIVNATAVLATPASERALRQRAEVLRIDDDAIAYALVKPEGKPTKPTPTPPPPETLPWGVDRIDADLVWDDHTGSGARVAVVDTGIDLDHPDLAANINGGYNAINPRKKAEDDNGHGTHVAGIIAAVDNEQGVIGVAPQASLYAVKVLGASGTGWFSDIIEGIQWSADKGMHVINMSLGSSANVQSMHDAVSYAYKKGVTVVAAAGNDYGGAVIYPAAYPEVIAVSATDYGNVIASFSNVGPEVDLAAPGVSIYSTYKGGTYEYMSGTSMAAPHVTGVAALVIAKGVKGPAAVKNKLTSSATDLGATGFDNLYGNGLVNAKNALK